MNECLKVLQCLVAATVGVGLCQPGRAAEHDLVREFCVVQQADPQILQQPQVYGNDPQTGQNGWYYSTVNTQDNQLNGTYAPMKINWAAVPHRGTGWSRGAEHAFPQRPSIFLGDADGKTCDDQGQPVKQPTALIIYTHTDPSGDYQAVLEWAAPENGRVTVDFKVRVPPFDTEYSNGLGWTLDHFDGAKVTTIGKRQVADNAGECTFRADNVRVRKGDRLQFRQDANGSVAYDPPGVLTGTLQFQRGP